MVAREARSVRWRFYKRRGRMIGIYTGVEGYEAGLAVVGMIVIFGFTFGWRVARSDRRWWVGLGWD